MFVQIKQSPVLIPCFFKVNVEVSVHSQHGISTYPWFAEAFSFSAVKKLGEMKNIVILNLT